MTNVRDRNTHNMAWSLGMIIIQVCDIYNRQKDALHFSNMTWPLDIITIQNLNTSYSED